MAKGRSGLSFSIPSGAGGTGPSDALIEQLPETLKDAIGEKKKPMSVTKAFEGANPYWSRAYAAYSENCQRCVVAYELRRRGYDVIAQPTYDGDKWPQNLSINGQALGRWRGAFRHAKTDAVGAAGNNAQAEAKVLSNINDQMHAYGDGSRAIIRIGYRGSNVGHVFNVENHNGRITFVDAQTGMRYINADMRNMMRVVDTRSVTLTRTDNLRISARAKEFVWQKNKNKT